MRKTTDYLIAVIAGSSALLAMAILGGLVFVVARRGIPALSWSFFTEQIRLVGAAGGIFWNLVGTIIILAAALVICKPLATALALLEQVWLRGSIARRFLRAGLYTLNGLPSILFGIFGFIVFVQWCGWGK